MNNENFEYCKSIAQELEAIANGEKHVCADCGHIIEDDDAMICPECESDELMSSSIYDYFSSTEIYDIEYTIGSDMQFRAVKLMVGCGGPNIYINTGTGSVQLFWWTEKAEYLFDLTTIDEINDYWEEIYLCHR